MNFLIKLYHIICLVKETNEVMKFLNKNFKLLISNLLL
jgi:hypothetical protein